MVEEARVLLAQGINPSEEKRERKEQQMLVIESSKLLQ